MAIGLGDRVFEAQLEDDSFFAAHAPTPKGIATPGTICNPPSECRDSRNLQSLPHRFWTASGNAVNAIVYEEEPGIRDCLFKFLLRELLCCLPRVAAPAGLTYKTIFRVLIGPLH